ncbi:hypothetical protein [Flavobacterium sp.]|uniref:hypothetical protein n=1 Tax=Flavobacterium sp. TaxID=239 RepID=UPI0026043195|nr:hypothetical protein [Flavobacterium sp.]
MKKITLLVILLLSTACIGQEQTTLADTLDTKCRHEIKIGLFKAILSGKVEAGYERIIAEDFSLGSYVMVNFDRTGAYIENFYASAFVRCYLMEFEGQYADGFFVDANIKYLNVTYDEYKRYYGGLHDFYGWEGAGSDDFYRWTGFKPKTTYDAIAVGAALGWKYQWKGISLELLLGGERRLLKLNHISEYMYRGDANICYRF